MERWHTTADVETYARHAVPWLERDPVRNNVLLTIIEHARRGSGTWQAEPVFAWCADDAIGAVTGAASWTAPYRLTVPQLDPPAADALAHHLHAQRRALPGVAGPAPTARTFADAWSTLTGCRVRVEHEERMYQLDALTPGPPAPGAPRAATEHDVPLIARWMAAFTQEAGVVPVDNEAWARGRLASLLIWRDGADDVTLVAHAPPVGGVARIGPVWTPPGFRRRGYATAAVAELTRRLLASGQRACMLYTDLANPTSNSIYQKIGYYPVGDALSLVFEP